MLYSNQEEQIIDNYLSFANDAVGILALSLGASALGFEHPQPFATFFLIVVVLWLASKQSQYKHVIKRYFEHYKGLSIIFILWKIKIYLIGVLFLGGIAMGEITKAGVYAFFGYST